MSEIELTFDDRVRLLLQHLGIERAHCAASVASDWRGLLTCPDDRLLSLALVSPMGFDADALRSIESRLLVIAADQGGVAQAVRLGIPTLPQATHCILSDYLAVGWSDIAADRTLDILSALEHFLDNQDTVGEADDLNLPSGQGEAGGITYQIRGSGPPLVLFPLWLAPAQWEPLIPQLSERYCTITLSGAHLGMAQNLEERLQTGFLSVFRSLIDEMELQPGDAVLDVGCGTGSFDRWMVGRIGNGLQVTGVDINPYILGVFCPKRQKGIFQT